MIRHVRPVGALVGGLLAAWSLLAVERVNAEWLAAMAAWVHGGPPDSDVAIVWVDATAAAHPAFSERPRAGWSAPIARVISKLIDAGATVVAVDLVLVRDDMVDREWLRTLRRAARDGRVVLGGGADAWPSRRQLAAVGTRSIASVMLQRDANGVVRSVPSVSDGRPSLAALAVTRSGAEVTDTVSVAVPGLPRFVNRSAAEVIDCTNSRLAEAFAGRTVFIGAKLPFEDRHTSPVRSLPEFARTLDTATCGGATDRIVLDDPVPGVLLHALAADAWLHRRTRSMPSRSSVLLVIVATAVAASLSGRWTASLALASTPVAVGLYGHGWVIPWLPMVVASAGTIASVSALATADAAWRFAITLPRRFRRHPHRSEVTELTVCFIDIESFTRTSETSADPAATARELGAALQAFTGIVERHGGFVDKYIGDAMLVLFGCDAGGDGREEAVSAAFACIEACDGADRLCIAGRPVKVRIGIACGPAHLGPVGNGPRVHFTAIGDVVNVAARLETMNRELGTRVLADAAVAAVVADGRRRVLGVRELRGRREPVQVYDLTPK